MAAPARCMEPATDSVTSQINGSLSSEPFLVTASQRPGPLRLTPMPRICQKCYIPACLCATPWRNSSFTVATKWTADAGVGTTPERILA
jgi:hypothetical protein